MLYLLFGLLLEKQFLKHLQSFAKILEKVHKLRKSCNHKRNINRVYNEKLHCTCLQQLAILRLKTLDPRKIGNLGERKWKAQTRASYPVFSHKIQFYSYFVENRQKATLNFYFKSRFFCETQLIPNIFCKRLYVVLFS